MSEDERPQLDEIAPRWDDGDDEYAVLADLVVPAAQERFYSGVRDWDALDTKAVGFLAIDAAAIGVLVAVHRVVNDLWWAPAAVCGIAGGLLVASIWPRNFVLGPDLFDLHDGMRDASPLEAAREMVNDVVIA